MAKVKMERSEDFKTEEGRLSYAQNLYEARAQEGSTKKKYGCTIIYPKSVLGGLEVRVAELIVKQWGQKAIQMAKDGLIKSPFLDGAGKSARNKTTGELHPGMGPGVFFIRPWAYAMTPEGLPKPPPWVRWKDPNRHAEYGPESVYSGCYGKPVVNLFCWDNESNGLGVSFGISGFQKLREGDPLGDIGTGGDPTKWIEAIEDVGEAPPETKTGAGASGLFG